MIWVIFAVAATLIAIRAMIGPSFADRVIAFDAIVNLVALLMVFQSIKVQSQLYLDIAVLITMLGFIGTLAIARYVKKQEKHKWRGVAE